jgi:hypothetical protein
LGAFNGFTVLKHLRPSFLYKTLKYSSNPIPVFLIFHHPT